MRNAKLWSVLLAAVLLCACVVGVLFTGASAGGVVTYGVNYTEGIDADKQFDTIGEVFDAVEAAIKNGEWTEGDTLEIKFAGSIEAKVNGSELVFGQKTIFTSTGKKLPIIIQGTEASDASTITVAADKIACANDYTFKDLTLDLDGRVVSTGTFGKNAASYNIGVSFFAGSGNITFDNVATFIVGTSVFGDNYTAEAFEGWTEADVEALKDEDGCILTSATFTDTGFQGPTSIANSGSTTSNDFNAGIAAVGASRNKDTGVDAYSAVISANCTITPANTKAKVAVTAGTINSRIGGYLPAYPARVHTAIIEQTGGTVGSLCGDEAGGHVLNYVENGNVEIYAENATKTSTIRVFYGGKGHNDMINTPDAPAGEYGNITVYAKNIKTGGDVFIAGSSDKTIPGKAKVTLDNFHHNGKSSVGSYSTFEFLGIGALGGTENNLNKCRVTGFSGCRYENVPADEIGAVSNTLTDVVYTASSSAYSYNPVAMRNSAKAVKVKSITNTLTNVSFGTTDNVISFYGSRSAVVSGTVKNVLTDCTFANSGDRYFYGLRNGSADRVENYIVGGTYRYIRGTQDGTVGTVVNNLDGPTFYNAYNGTYTTTVTDKLETNVKSGSYKSFYVCFGGSNVNIGDVVTNISGGNFGGLALLGGYGGKSVRSVTTTISGTAHFNNTDSSAFFATGNDNWPGYVTGDVKTTILGGTFDHYLYLGARAGAIGGDVINNIKGGTFNSTVYGGGFGTAYVKDSYTYDDDFLCKSVEGTIYNNIGEEGSATAPVFNKDFVAGFRGDNSASASVNKSDCSIVNTVYNATFAGNFYGGNASYAYRSKNASAEAYSIKFDVTNNIYGGTFKKSFMAASTTGSFKPESGEVAATVSQATIINNIYGGRFVGEYFGGMGASSASMPMNITNHFYGGTLEAVDNYLGCGNFTETYGTITNIFEDGFVASTAYIYAAGGGTVNPVAGMENQPVVINTVNGGEFTGFWGAGGNANLVVNGDVVTNVYGGTFKPYNSDNLVNGISGGVRNGTMNGNTTLNIYGGTFSGVVSGGTFLGSSDYKDRHINGATELNIYGGTFTRNVFAGSYNATVLATNGSTLNLVPTEGYTITIYADFTDVTKIDATSDVAINLGKSAYVKAEKLVGTLKVNQIEAWLPATYVEILAADAAIEGTKADGIVGECEKITADTTILRGVGGAEIKQASLLISDRIQIKLMFAQAEIDALAADFEFVFKTRDGAVLATVNKATLGEAADGYYSCVLSAMGLSEFDVNVICTGNGLYRNNVSVNGLAQMGADYYTTTVPNETYAALFASIANLGSVGNGGELLYGTEPVIKDVDYSAWNIQQKDETVLKLQSMNLIMTDAIGVRLNGYTVAADTPVKVFCGDVDVTEYCVIKRATEASEGTYALSVSLYVSVGSMTEELPIKITDGENELFTMNLRIDALAEKVVEADNTNLLAKCALAYIQAADAYKNPVA